MNESDLISLFGPAHQIMNPLELVQNPDSLASHLHNFKTQQKFHEKNRRKNLFSARLKGPKKNKKKKHGGHFDWDARRPVTWGPGELITCDDLEAFFFF